MSEFISFTQAAALIPDGATVMFGGFMGCGNAHHVIAELARLGTKNLTMICNDGALFNGPDGSKYYGVAKLIHNHQISKMYATHVGLNPEVAEQMNDGSLDVVLIPQGSFVEMIRAAGGGLGGILTRTGVGTIVEDSEFVDSKVRIDGQTYLLEKPLHADFSVISGYRIDKAGNIWYKGTTRNFAPYMAMAADVVIAEAENVVEVGAIEPENVVTSGILVDYVATAQAVEQ